MLTIDFHLIIINFDKMNDEIFRGVRFDRNQEDIIDEDQDNEVQTNGTIEHSSDQDDSEEDMKSANAEVNHDGDDENYDTTSESDEEVKNEGSNKIDAEETVEKNSETKDGLISGFFRKLSNKKSTDAKVESDANANANEDVVEKETDNEARESESKDTGKDNKVVEGKKRVSFLQKIGYFMWAEIGFRMLNSFKKKIFE